VREVQASEAKARLANLLDAVERGETIVITRQGKPIARIVPEADRHPTEVNRVTAEIARRQAEIEHRQAEIERRQAEIERVAAEIEKFRRTMPDISLEEILSTRGGGYKH
jgi:prevent-host-death family protein